MNNACLVCGEKEAIDSGMCEDCHDKASDYQKQKYYEEEKRLKKVKSR